MMTETPIPKLIRIMAVPPVISMLITAIYNLADTFFVSQISTSASAAVGIIFSLMAIIQAVGFTLGMGAGLNISRLLGRQDRESAHQYASVSFFGGLAIGVLFMLTGLFILEGLVLRLGATPTIFPYARDYARIILFGTPFMIASYVLNNTLRSQGNSFQAMIGIGAGAALNIALDPLFIFVFGWGIAGAAIATIMGQIVSFFLLIVMISGSTGGARVGWRYFRLSRQVVSSILSNGMPSFYRQILSSLATIAINVCARPYGDAAIAALSIATRINMFLLSAILGFGQGFMPVCGFNYGAERYRRVWESYLFCLKLAVSVLALVGVVVFFWATPIVRVFRREDLDVIRIGALTLRLQCVALPLQASTIINNMLAQALGKTRQAAVLAVTRQGLFLFPLVLTLPRIMGLLGIQAAQPLSDILSTCMMIIIMLPIVRAIKEKCAEETKAGAH
jgi:putative MATE family efflux protein